MIYLPSSIKRCTKCDTYFPATLEYFHRSKRSGLSHYCRTCNNKRPLEWAAKNYEKALNLKREYYQRHKERIKKNVKSYRDSNLEKVSRRERQYQADHREEAKVRSRKWYNENKVRAKKSSARWQKDNLDKVKRYQKKCQNNRKAKHRIEQQRRRAKKKRLLSTLTHAHWRHALEYFNNSCAYCGITDTPLHQEHFVPVNAGGPYTVTNIVPACQSCNSKKSDKDALAWLAAKHGSATAELIIQRITEYFESVTDNH